jgi:hypothetical protein
MKGRFFFALFFSYALATVSLAAEKQFGLGLIIGEPTGLSGKLRLSHYNSIDAGMAWSFRRSGHLHLHADYLWEFPDVIRASEEFTLFAGIGGRLTFGKREGVLGLRIVGGLAWLPRNSPLELFMEVAPILDIVPATDFSANGGIGVRFFF